MVIWALGGSYYKRGGNIVTDCGAGLLPWVLQVNSWGGYNSCLQLPVCVMGVGVALSRLTGVLTGA